jgi:hypothetical protein
MLYKMAIQILQNWILNQVFGGLMGAAGGAAGGATGGSTPVPAAGMSSGGMLNALGLGALQAVLTACRATVSHTSIKAKVC